MTSEIKITSQTGSSTALITTHGATVLSWAVNGNERLFLSRLANASNPVPGKGIRGGIPVVFPHVGPWDCGPQHGFARGKEWKVSSHTTSSVSFLLQNDSETEAMWNHKFQLKYTVLVKDSSLVTTLNVKNNNSAAEFDFTTLLHTYLRVPNVKNIRITGLENMDYRDGLTGRTERGEEGELHGIHENVERVYLGTEGKHAVLKFDSATIRIEKRNLPDTVLWNPWVEKAKGMKDFGDEEYLNMVGIEAGKVSERQILPVGESWECEQIFTEVPSCN